MSYVFQHEDKTIWEPRNGVAGLFLASISHIENRLGIGSGLTETMSDTIEVDFAQFSRFLVALPRKINLENSSMRILVRPIIVHLMALLYCGGDSFTDIERGFPDEWVDESPQLARTNMWRIGNPLPTG